VRNDRKIAKLSKVDSHIAAALAGAGRAAKRTQTTTLRGLVLQARLMLVA
jgi:hypothetical protein